MLHMDKHLNTNTIEIGVILTTKSPNQETAIKIQALISHWLDDVGA